MNNLHLRGVLSAICVASILAGFTKVTAGPVRFDQVIQVVNAGPGTAQTGSFSRLRLIGGDDPVIFADDDDDKKKKDAQPQDGRVITETKIDIVKDDVCDCEEETVVKRGFPKWALLGLAVIPIAFILIKRKKDTPTPTATLPPPPFVTPTPTPTPMTPTPTPPITPTPTPPEPVPEPVTILLFGTGLASVGLAARRRFGKKGERSDDKDEK